ncbi:MAG: calcium/sodium antiporter [Gemmatimonadetes bacterium]|nr:calcium/sodium antiporter [Gemmatimonadota bacterium]
MATLPAWANSLVVLVTFLGIAVGAKYVVDSAASLAHRAGISELVVGLTVVAFGTSAPEFAVTLVAAFEGQSSISVGNVVGSNIFNLGFILGSAALLRAIPTDSLLVWRDGLVLVGATVVLYLLVALDLHLGLMDGMILLGLLTGYLLLIWKGRHDGASVSAPAPDEVRGPSARPWKDGLLLLFGLALVGVSSHFLVGSATALARSFGVSEWVIGVTVVAAGTSVPELATTLAGVVRGHTALSAGNVIGSDIFNILGVLGVAGVLHPMSLDPAARTSLLALSGMVMVVLLVMRTGWRISRAEGFALVAMGALRWALDLAARHP